MAQYQANGHLAPPGLAVQSSASALAGPTPPLVPATSPKPSLAPGSIPSEVRNQKVIFKYAYHNRAELEAISRSQGSQADGMDVAMEDRRRRNYVSWMTQLTHELHLPHDVLSTALVYMHRYFAVKVRPGIPPLQMP